MYNLNYLVTYLREWMMRHPNITTVYMVGLMSILSLDLTLGYYMQTHYEHKDENRDTYIPYCAVFFCMVCKFALLAAMMIKYFSPVRHLNEYLAGRQRKRFASFIVRRLIYQLDVASRIMGPIGENLSKYHEATETAYRAVAEFRRDANALLVERPSSSDGDLQFFVLAEEEAELTEAGYGQRDIDVTVEMLLDLVGCQQ
ncbi:uncharacterized protein [Drosophila tropicalis]|uniref:uncharacterized protein n=1 Tax=Drosophila tropicalis TaxID=46794 RepID=UPI0035AC060D